MPPAPYLSLSPRDHHLDEVVARLSARGDNRGVIRLVEAWMAQGAPTSRARLLQARAFFSLRLMDRATMRARELGESAEDQPEALQLLARIYVERGWPLRARKPLLALREAGHDVEELWRRAHQEPIRPELHARDIEREALPERLLGLAESFLATGSYLRASGILERLRRADPDNERVNELLWGIAGDFSASSGSIEDLVGELDRAVDGAPADEGEHTESAPAAREPLADDARRFPALFKHGAPPSGAPGGLDDEHTHSSGLATPEEMAVVPEGTEPGLKVVNVAGGTGAGDTQILLVLRPGEDGHRRQAHRLREMPDGAPLNLREWQESMGVGPVVSPARDMTEDRMEAEDENVVMMTRPEAPSPVDPEPTESRARPIEVIEKHGTPLGISAPRPAPPPAPTPAPEVEVVPPPPLGLPRIGLLVGAGMLLLMVIAALLVLAFGQLRPMILGRRTDVEDVLAQSRVRALVQEERALEARGPGDPDAALALARVRLAIWRDWDGDPERIQQVRQFLENPGAADAQGVKVLVAAEALARNDLVTAGEALVGRAPRSPEERLVFDELSLRLGQPLAEYPGISTTPLTPHGRLVHATARAVAGHVADARDLTAAAIAEDPEDIQATVLALEVSDAEPAARLDRVSSLLRREVSPRLEARLCAVAARALTELSREEEAARYVERGLAQDGTNPSLLRARAATRVAQHALVDAARDLELAGRSPGLVSAVDVAHTLVLLDLDRVEEATSRAAETRTRDRTLGAVLGVVVSVAGAGVVPESFPPLGADALGAYADALVALAIAAPDAPSRLAEAATRLSEADDPFLTRLAPRVRVLQATTDPAGATELVAVVEQEGADDPMAHLALAGFFEQQGERARAAMHLDRAAALGPEYARVWYERARFYEDAADPQERSQDARFRYLGLSPTGPRAARASTWVASAG